VTSHLSILNFPSQWDKWGGLSSEENLACGAGCPWSIGRMDRTLSQYAHNSPEAFAAMMRPIAVILALLVTMEILCGTSMADDDQASLDGRSQIPRDDSEVLSGAEIQPVPATPYVADFSPISASIGCQSCGGGHAHLHNRCGCNPAMFPWIDGPGNCDQWCVGPKWNVEADGLMIFRDDAAWDPILAVVGTAPSLVTQFDQAPGARIFVTGYNHSNFGMQIGYEGVYSWDATAEFPQAGSVRTFDYETSLNSVEINFFPRRDDPWKLFAGFRYVEIQENFSDFTTVDKVIPVPADPPAASVPYVDTETEYLLKNRLLGFQLGARRDTWQWKKWFTLESFANAGVYSNLFRRSNADRTVTTVITGDDLSTPDTNEFSQQVTTTGTELRGDFTDVAFLGEVGITGVVRIHPCVALRGGYQAMVVDGIGQGIDAFFAGGLNNGTVLYHGLQFGIEYRR
jgi:hypothetical protein